MASIQIQASSAIISCNERINSYRKEYKKQESSLRKRREKAILSGDLINDRHANHFPTEISEVRKILKLAEYADDIAKSIIIDQNDFELIGEFL